MFFELTHHLLLPMLFLTGFIAGTVDAIAGGGGLISLPVLLGVGMPPHLALGTNKLQSSCGTFIAAHSYYRQGLIDKRKLVIGLVFTFIGALTGAITIQILNGDLLKKIIPILLLIILLYTIFTPRFGSIEQTAKISERLFFIIFGFILGFYDGFLGPGVGSFWVFAFMFFAGFNLIHATAYTKVFNLNTNLVALICFAIGNNIDYRVGLCMAAGQILGGRLGAYLAIKKGARLIRPVFIIVVSITVATLFYKNYWNTFSVGHEISLNVMIISVVVLTLSIILIYFWKIRRQINRS
jgi:uncharacterized membrane protein YfcA